MNKKPSALDQAMSYIRSVAGTSFEDIAPKLLEALPPTGALKQAKELLSRQTSKMGKETRAQKGAGPIASLKTGDVLYSDGSVRRSPESAKLDALRDNVLAQRNFTQQAEQYLRNLPIGYDVDTRIDPQTNRVTLGTYTHPQGKSGRIDMNYGAVSGQYGPSAAADTLVHEFLHSLDANLNLGESEGVQNKGKSSGNSYDFTTGLKEAEVDPEIMREIDDFLITYDKDKRTQDAESYAKMGEKKGEKVLLTKLAPTYNNVFVPGSKAQNASPVYPTGDTFQDIVADLDKFLIGPRKKKR